MDMEILSSCFLIGIAVVPTFDYKAYIILIVEISNEYIFHRNDKLVVLEYISKYQIELWKFSRKKYCVYNCFSINHFKI